MINLSQHWTEANHLLSDLDKQRGGHLKVVLHDLTFTWLTERQDWMFTQAHVKGIFFLRDVLAGSVDTSYALEILKVIGVVVKVAPTPGLSDSPMSLREALEDAIACEQVSLSQARERGDGRMARAHQACIDRWSKALNQDDAATKLKRLEENIEYLLRGPDVVRVREGGGPEDLAASLAVTVGKIRQQRDEALDKGDVTRWKVQLSVPVPGDPYNAFNCHAVDVGYADRILKVECTDAELVTKARFEEVFKNPAQLHAMICRYGPEGYELLATTGQAKGSEVFDTFLKVLNDAFSADPAAMHSLCVNRVPCNKTLAAHPTIQVDLSPGGTHSTVGLLGIINGICEKATGRRVSAKFEKDGNEVAHPSHQIYKMTGFIEYTPAT